MITDHRGVKKLLFNFCYWCAFKWLYRELSCTWLIFCQSLSNLAFSSLGPARRVLRPSDILIPNWKAALQDKSFVRQSWSGKVKHAASNFTAPLNIYPLLCLHQYTFHQWTFCRPKISTGLKIYSHKEQVHLLFFYDYSLSQVIVYSTIGWN